VDSERGGRHHTIVEAAPSDICRRQLCVHVHTNLYDGSDWIHNGQQEPGEYLRTCVRSSAWILICEMNLYTHVSRNILAKKLLNSAKTTEI